MKNRTANQISMVKRLIKMLFEFYPKLLPVIILLTIVNAILGSLPAVFQQNIVSILQQAWDNGWTWEITRPLVMEVVFGLLFVYAIALAINFINQQMLAIFTQGSLDKMRKRYLIIWNIYQFVSLIKINAVISCRITLMILKLCDR